MMRLHLVAGREVELYPWPWRLGARAVPVELKSFSRMQLRGCWPEPELNVNPQLSGTSYLVTRIDGTSSCTFRKTSLNAPLSRGT